MAKWIPMHKSKPPINTIVNLAFIVSGIGAPEVECWQTKGKLLASGRFFVKQNTSKTVDFRTPTHWCELTKSPTQ